MMHRRVFVIQSLAVLAMARAAGAQKVPRIGFIGNSNPTLQAPMVAAFRRGLNELGWIEGRTISVEYRWANGNLERHPALMAELVGLPVNVLVIAGTVATQAARRVTSSVPIVVAIMSDPVSLGFAASLAKPGGNITGLSNQFEDVVGKQLQILKEAMPSAHRVALLSHALQPAMLRQVAVDAARGLGLRASTFEVREETEFDGAMRAAKKDADAMHVLPSPFFNAHRARLAALAMKHRLPSIYEVKEYVEAGGFMSYGPSFPAMYRRSASYVDRILKGAKPGDLPIEQATEFELAINLKAARALGVTLPPALLLRADRVVE